MFKTIGYAIKQASIQVFRNRTMTVASMFSITAMLLILGLFFILVVNVNLASENAKKQFDTIQLYLLDTTDETATQGMIDSLQSMPEVEEAVYVDKEMAMQEFRKSWGDKAYLLDGLNTNPLPNSIRITVTNLEDADLVVEVSKSFQGVEDIKYYQTEVNQVLQITDFIQVGALVIIVFLVFVSIIVVSNTVKLTVLAREREISIMKYMGATNWFIRGPFLAEGMLIGCLSALISSGLIAFIYYKICELFSVKALALLSTSFVPLSFLIWNLVWIFIALGVCIGAFGSIVSMRRFLDT
ncbi:permease-like cell division protein FtsX [Sinanaerobacter sp. ZZT-01]|uniref:permease-like cell division protein FtsX n=1 Tax=Sinanaerobacter sp. ZZT-01 TaxID=3111540 RepID=UPI002D77B83B|nr:permease-like cell division protein FtsX [Sinanaerobacter sp. ZZT-01]WRR93493.1 permease-like cell division protein FtsX [Sinanaerobacter sp. ZZT-01]